MSPGNDSRRKTCIRTSFTGMWAGVLIGLIAWALAIAIIFFRSLFGGYEFDLLGVHLVQSGDGGFQMMFDGAFVAKLAVVLAILGLFMGFGTGFFKSRGE